MPQPMRRALMTALALTFALLNSAAVAQQNCDLDREVLERLRAEAAPIDKRLPYLETARAALEGLSEKDLEARQGYMLKQIRTSNRSVDELAEYRQVLDVISSIRARRAGLGINLPSPDEVMKKRRTYLATQISLIADRFEANRCPRCSAAGNWTLSIPELGPPSTLAIGADGTAHELSNNASGRVSQSGDTLTIEWSTPDGAAGTFIAQIAKDCRSATGTINWTKAPPGISPRNYDATMSRT